MTDKEFLSFISTRFRQKQFQEAIGKEVTKRLMSMRVNYMLRWGSDPYTMFKLYVDITRGIKCG